MGKKSGIRETDEKRAGCGILAKKGRECGIKTPPFQTLIYDFEQKFLSWKEFQHILPEAIFDIYVAVYILSQVIFIFSFVSTLLAYIT